MRQKKLQQDEIKKKEAIELSLKRKEKEGKNLLTKQKNEVLIMERRKKLIEKYTQSEEKIKKQKEDNDKDLMNKYLMAAMKREDTAENLSRYERQQELERQKKVLKIEQRNEKMADMQREKEKIYNQKRTLGNNLAERKKLLMDKVSNILSTGHFKTKEDIYRKVFNEDELQTLGYNMNKTINTNSNDPKKKESSKHVIEESNKKEEGFFLTQGNNINNENKDKNVEESQ